MSLQLLRPRVSNLVFQLYDRPLHPELFNVAAQRRIEREDGEILVRITRTGHMVSWKSEEACLTEIAAARHEPLPERGRLLRYRMRGEQQGDLRLGKHVRYRVSFHVEELPAEVYCHVHDEILADGEARGLLHNFQPNHRLALSPLGLVAIDGCKGSLVIHSFHTFPGELAIVRSQSLIEVNRP